MTQLGEELAAYLRSFVTRDGPKESDYPELKRRIAAAHAAVEAGALSRGEVVAVLDGLGRVASLDTMQGFALRKPHGHAGDFEIIDRIYAEWVSPHPELAAWDRYFHSQAAPRAVRNRKAYFHRLLDELRMRRVDARVLKLGSGPGRSMFEWLRANPEARVRFECVEVCPRAVEFARRLNEPHLDRVTFHQRNVFRYRPEGEYDLVWAAGLFDYFDDRVFVSVGRRVWPAVASGGELVVGNFARGNPPRAYMELVGDWRLYHRSPDELARLVEGCGADPSCVRVGSEPEGINLFAHAGRA